MLRVRGRPTVLFFWFWVSLIPSGVCETLFHDATQLPPSIANTLKKFGKTAVSQAESAEIPALTAQVSTLIEKLRQPGDADPMHWALVDDLSPNAAMSRDHESGTAGKLIMINLGLLRFVQSDDELAFVLGHELGHGVSEIHHAHQHLGRQGEEGFLKCALSRAEESEVDLKALQRIQKVGYNSGASLDFMKRVAAKYGDSASSSHPGALHRADILSQALTGIRRVGGVDLSERAPQRQIITRVQAGYLSEATIKERQQSRIQQVIQAPMPDLAATVRRESESDYNLFHLSLYSSEMSRRAESLRKLGSEVFSQEEIQEFCRQAHLHLDAQFEQLREELVKHQPESASTIRQLAILDQRDYKSGVKTDPRSDQVIDPELRSLGLKQAKRMLENYPKLLESAPQISVEDFGFGVTRIKGIENFPKESFGAYQAGLRKTVNQLQALGATVNPRDTLWIHPDDTFGSPVLFKTAFQFDRKGTLKSYREVLLQLLKSTPASLISLVPHHPQKYGIMGRRIDPSMGIELFTPELRAAYFQALERFQDTYFEDKSKILHELTDYFGMIPGFDPIRETAAIEGKIVNSKLESVISEFGLSRDQAMAYLALKNPELKFVTAHFASEPRRFIQHLDEALTRIKEKKGHHFFRSFQDARRGTLGLSSLAPYLGKRVDQAVIELLENHLIDFWWDSPNDSVSTLNPKLVSLIHQMQKQWADRQLPAKPAALQFWNQNSERFWSNNGALRDYLIRQFSKTWQERNREETNHEKYAATFNKLREELSYPFRQYGEDSVTQLFTNDLVAEVLEAEAVKTLPNKSPAQRLELALLGFQTFPPGYLSKRNLEPSMQAVIKGKTWAKLSDHELQLLFQAWKHRIESGKSSYFSKNLTSSETDFWLEGFLSLDLNQPRYAKIKEELMDPARVKFAHFEQNQKKLALWQLTQKFSLLQLKTQLYSPGSAVPLAQDKKEPRWSQLHEIRSFLDRQFDAQSKTKNEVITFIENALLTNLPETDALKPARLTSENWAQQRYQLAAFEAPHLVADGLKSQKDRIELLRYLIGDLDEIPQSTLTAYFSQRGGSDGSTRRLLADAKRFFHEADHHARTYVLMPLLNPQRGLLSEPASTEEVIQLILGENAKNATLRTLFDSYLESAPTGEKQTLIAHVLGTFSDRPPGKAPSGASLKQILESMGPFGIKAGQFLRSSGALPPSMRSELDSFFDHALPPERPEILGRLQEVFGESLPDLVRVRQLVGAGSINYVVLADLRDRATGQEHPVVIRSLRSSVEGKLANENQIWERAITRLKAHADPQIKKMGDLMHEARTHAYSTLGPGGAEVNLEVERLAYPQAQHAYERLDPGTTESGYRIEVSQPAEGLQAQSVPDAYRSSIAIYHYVPNVPLKQVTDRALQTALAKDIVSAELEALFQKGQFDADGHPGNWLISPQDRRLVRIDYSQIQKLSEPQRLALRNVFAILLQKNISQEGVSKIAEYFGDLFVSTPSEGRQALEARLSKLVKSSDFPSRFEPHERLYAIQKLFNLQFNPATRSALSSLMRISIYREYMSNIDFATLVFNTLGLNGTFEYWSMQRYRDLTRALNSVQRALNRLRPPGLCQALPAGM